MASITAGVAAATVLGTSWHAVSAGSSSDSDLHAGNPASSTTSTTPASPTAAQDPELVPHGPLTLPILESTGR